MSNVLATRQKDPDEVKDYGLNWADWLNENTPDDTISTSDWTATAGITLGVKSNDTTTTTQWVSGGTHGSDYVLVNRIVTAGGRTAERALLIQVRSVGPI
jgi:hypothetical protein